MAPSTTTEGCKSFADAQLLRVPGAGAARFALGGPARITHGGPAMAIRLGTWVLVPAVLAAGALAFYEIERAPEATAATPVATAAPPPVEDEVLPSGNGGALPPNHPPIGGLGASQEPAFAADDAAPAILWKMPAGWEEAASPNAMRLATYRAPGGVEVSVSRAGGAPEANIQRWMAQFDDLGSHGRVEKTVHGLQVITVDASGTFLGGGMTPGAAPEPKRGWAMVGAIIESRSPSYFFKMTGPAAAISAARPAFDRLVDSITPA